MLLSNLFFLSLFTPLFLFFTKIHLFLRSTRMFIKTFSSNLQENIKILLTFSIPSYYSLISIFRSSLHVDLSSYSIRILLLHFFIGTSPINEDITIINQKTKLEKRMTQDNNGEFRLSKNSFFRIHIHTQRSC